MGYPVSVSIFLAMPCHLSANRPPATRRHWTPTRRLSWYVLVLFDVLIIIEYLIPCESRTCKLVGSQKLGFSTAGRQYLGFSIARPRLFAALDLLDHVVGKVSRSRRSWRKETMTVVQPGECIAQTMTVVILE